MTNEERTEEKSVAVVEHLDTQRVPPWLMEAAKASSPDSMGWLVSGYLAGVDVARKAGPCGAQLAFELMGLPVILTCRLAVKHLGAHEVIHTFNWSDASPSHNGAES